MVTSQTRATEKISNLAARLAARPGSVLFVPLAEAYRQAGRLSEAEAVLRRGLADRPEHHTARVALARVLVERGEEGSARPELERVLDAVPDNLLAARLLDQIGAAGPVAESAGAARVPEEPAPAPADRLSSLTLAELYLQQGDREAALSVYRDVAAREAGNPGLQAWYETMLGTETSAPPDPTTPAGVAPVQSKPAVPTDWKRPAEPRLVALRRFLDAARRLRAPHA